MLLKEAKPFEPEADNTDVGRGIMKTHTPFSAYTPSYCALPEASYTRTSAAQHDNRAASDATQLRGTRWALVIVCALLNISHATAQPSITNPASGQSLNNPTELYIYGSSFTAPLQKVPQSTTVVREQRLQEKGENSFDYEIESIPNLTWSAGTSRPRFFLMRGIGELEQYQGAPNPSVATIIDSIDFSGLGLVTPMFDIDQVEVLRGPQGIRFGSSALAGALNVRSHDPTEFTTGRLELMAGNDELFAGGVAVGGAIPESNGKLQLRFSAYNSQSDGFRNNVFLQRDNTNKRDESLARLKLRYIPSSKLSFNLSVWGVEAKNGYDAFALDNSFNTQSDKPGQDATSVRAASFATNAKLSEGVALESISSIARTSIDYSYDGDWGNNPFWGAYAPYDYFSDSGRTRKVLSQEFRLRSPDDATYQHGESWRWLTGVFAQRLSEDTSTLELADNVAYNDISNDYLARTGAIFGDLEVPLSNGFSLVPGLRVEQRNTRYDDSRSADFSPTYSMLGGSTAIQKDLTESVRGYLSVSRGYKGGGFNPGTRVPTERRQYDPEYLWNFELGTKGTFLDKKLSSNLALFYNLRRDQQLKFAIQDNPSDPLSFTYLTESSAEGRSIGLELENTYQALPWWQLFVSGSLLDSEFTSVPSESSDLQGRAVSGAPSWQYSAGTRADFGHGVFGRIEITGKDAFYFDDSHNQHSSPYALFNASLGWRHDRWQVLLWSRNLFNERYDVRGFYFGNEPPDFPNRLYVQRGDPRAFGCTLSYNF
jgi:outer membrane receptor protein involved in Fe transport